jgi:hypothetical protein
VWVSVCSCLRACHQLVLLSDSHICCFAQEQAGLLPWGTVACATGSFPREASEASLAGHLERTQKDHPLGIVSSSGTSKACWVWLCTRTQPCLSLSARTATPSSTSATVSSGPSCRESMCHRPASGTLVRSRLCSITGMFRGSAACAGCCYRAGSTVVGSSVEGWMERRDRNLQRVPTKRQLGKFETLEAPN